jgi:steroid 5-alpha reductase family enzyme
VSIIDSFWGPGFIAIAWTSFALTPDVAPRRLLVSAMISVWGLRLAAYRAWRNLGHGEDYRYRAMLPVPGRVDVARVAAGAGGAMAGRDRADRPSAFFPRAPRRSV